MSLTVIALRNKAGYLLFSKAKLTLALRASGDDTSVVTDPATLQYLLDEYDITLPAKLPYGMQPRTDGLSLPALPNDYTSAPE